MACSKSDNEDKDVGNFDDPDPVAKLTIENDKVTCEACDGFGKMLEAHQNQVFVGGERQVWIFEYTAQGITLSQEIDLTNFGFLNSITAKDGTLFLGVFDDMGTGSVRQYEANGTEWQFTMGYEIGRNQDDFGNDIAISDTLMVIGASARWVNRPMSPIMMQVYFISTIRKVLIGFKPKNLTVKTDLLMTDLARM